MSCLPTVLTRLFGYGDRCVENFSAAIDRLGLSGCVVVGIVLYGTYGAVDLIRFIAAH